eukprot:1242621-Rhodomonas_salina.1
MQAHLFGVDSKSKRVLQQIFPERGKLGSKLSAKDSRRADVVKSKVKQNIRKSFVHLTHDCEKCGKSCEGKLQLPCGRKVWLCIACAKVFVNVLSQNLSGRKNRDRLNFRPPSGPIKMIAADGSALPKTEPRQTTTDLRPTGREIVRVPKQSDRADTPELGAVTISSTPAPREVMVPRKVSIAQSASARQELAGARSDLLEALKD